MHVPDPPCQPGRKIISGPEDIQHHHAGIKRFAVDEPGNGIILGIVYRYPGIGFVGFCNFLFGPEQPYRLDQGKNRNGPPTLNVL